MFLNMNGKGILLGPNISSRSIFALQLAAKIHVRIKVLIQLLRPDYIH